MPIYEYEHLIRGACPRGHAFETRQSISDAPLQRCPDCGQAVKKLISRTAFSSPKTNGELRDMGFTKLVRRDDGVYENVTRRDAEHRYMQRGNPAGVPDLSKTIRD